MNKKEILVDGHFYDVTDFIKRHPGGSIMDYYTKPGEDATHAVQQFHQRSSKRVLSVMSSLKKRPAPDSEIQLDPATLERHRALTEDFNKLYLELEREGYFKPSYVHVVLRFAEMIAFFAVGLYLDTFPYFIVQFCGVLCCVMSMGRCGWFMHEGGHHSLTGNPRVDKFVANMCFGLIGGQSNSWWRSNHNRHHAMPQRFKRDVDLSTMPLLAFNSIVVKDGKAGRSFLVQFQAYLFPLFSTTIVAAVWMLYLQPKYVLKHRLYLEMAYLVAHYFFFCRFALWKNLIGAWIVGVYFLLNFSLNHTHMPATAEPKHWVEYAFAHTSDVEQRPWCDWWMGYLNYQIEHHLFPTMPQFRHRLIKDRVRALAEKHNIPYVVNSYAEAVQKTIKNLANVSKEVREW